MKKRQKVNSGFTRLSDENLMVFAQTVLAAMTNNQHFSSPEPDLIEVEIVLEDYSEKLAISRKRGGAYDTATKNEAREIIERTLSELAFYVNKIAQGNLPIMLSSGFQISKYRSSVLPPARVQHLLLSDGRQSGQMVLEFKKLKNAILYAYRYTKDKDATGKPDWNAEIHNTTSSRNNVIAPVLPGEIYYVSVRAINSRGTGDWSETVSWMAR